MLKTYADFGIRTQEGRFSVCNDTNFIKSTFIQIFPKLITIHTYGIIKVWSYLFFSFNQNKSFIFWKLVYFFLNSNISVSFDFIINIINHKIRIIGVPFSINTIRKMFLTFSYFYTMLQLINDPRKLPSRTAIESLIPTFITSTRTLS